MPTQSVTLTSITTDKFKTGTLIFSVNIPNDKLFSPYSLLLTEVLQRATASFPTKAILQKHLDELYSTTVSIRCAKHGKSRAYTFSAEILDNCYSDGEIDIALEASKVLYELIYNPLLDNDGYFFEQSVEQEKRRTANYLRSTKNNPARYASTRLSELLLRDDESASTLEEMIEAVENCDRYKLTEFYKSTLACRPINVFYIGTLSHSEISNKVMSFLNTHSALHIDSPMSPKPIEGRKEIAKKDESMPISQGRLAIGFTSDGCIADENYYALTLFNEIFGGGPSSKLFMNVREKMSLCYSCSSLYNVFDGTIRVSAGISPQNRDIAQKAILKDFENIKKGKISHKELISAKKAIENSYREIYDNPADILGFYLVRHALGIDVTIDECREKFSKLTIDDVVSVANKVKLDSVYFLCGDADDGEQEEAYDE